ncbi:hypothetical protein KKD95_02735 [Patescibacteria group bacterium]|nr:hypothetical protein [Patescibacteria group bacterium]
MRTSVLSILVFGSVIGVASVACAQDRSPANIQFVHEPTGQEFSPPPVRFVRTSLAEQRIAERQRAMDNVTCAYEHGVAGCQQQPFASDERILLAERMCAERVHQVYSYRSQIYLTCLREELVPQGFTVLEPSQVAAYYSVATN